MPNAETLPLLLKQIGLPKMLEQWEQIEVRAQEKSWRYAQYLATLCELEAANRAQKRIARHTKESKLPPGKTLATFDFNKSKSVDKKHIEAMAENPSWVKDAENIVIFGPSGVGKTHIAAAIGHRLIEQGVRVLFSSTTSLVQKLQHARTEYKLPEALAKLSRYPLLILDDIGYAKKDDMETSVLFELIAERYESSSIIITANQPFAEWDKVFPDNMMAVAAIDRLIHHASIINIQDESYRKNTAKNN
jgi:DNA replication protein DnaC